MTERNKWIHDLMDNAIGNMEWIAREARHNCAFTFIVLGQREKLGKKVQLNLAATEPPVTEIPP